MRCATVRQPDDLRTARREAYLLVVAGGVGSAPVGGFAEAGALTAGRARRPGWAAPLPFAQLSSRFSGGKLRYSFRGTAARLSAGSVFSSLYCSRALRRSST